MKVDQLRAHAVRLGFTPQDQVRWLAPAQLSRTAIKVGLSSLFADFADRREVQAALPMPPIEVAPNVDGGLWFDFVADLGDGFDPTFTVALLLAEERLGIDGLAGPLPRGTVLVLGGDEVYPTPSATGYEDRTKGPYRAALPAAQPPVLPHQQPLLLALPGNHDWYDGLAAFLRVFAQGRPIGGWRTEQTRSYFAVRLPGRWWLVGVDTQLGNYIDTPQIAYFREHLSGRVQPGDGVILCVPAPTWVHTGEGAPDDFNSLHWFERNVVERHPDHDGVLQPTGARVRLWLTGDKHHYARYAEELGPDAEVGAARQLVTCGLGGSFLTETHRLPEQLRLPSPQSRMPLRETPSDFTLAARYPSPALTRALIPRLASLGPFGAPMRNPGLWRLCGFVQALVVLVLTSVLAVQLQVDPVGALRASGWQGVLHLAGQALVWGTVVVAGLSLTPVMRGRLPSPPSEVVWAVLLQLVVSFATVAAAASVPWPASWAPWAVLGLVLLATVVVSGLVASYAFALYILTSRIHVVRGWQMSAQAVEDYKGFLRLRLDPDGTVTVYPIALDQVCHDWRLDGVRPAPASGLPVPHLIEPPFRVARTVADRAGLPA
jgi:hypothetical protein